MATKTFNLREKPIDTTERFKFNRLQEGYQPIKLARDEETKEYYLVAESTLMVKPCNGVHKPGCRHFTPVGDGQFSYLVYAGPEDNFARVSVTSVRPFSDGSVRFSFYRQNQAGDLFFPSYEKNQQPGGAYHPPTLRHKGRSVSLTDLSDRL